MSHFDFKIRVIYTIILKIYTYVAMPTCQDFNAVAPQIVSYTSYTIAYGAPGKITGI